MRKFSMKQLEQKYIRGNVERFDQNNLMFTRPGWDPEVHDKAKDWGLYAAVSDKPGYRLEDCALSLALVSGMVMNGLHNTSKPNPEMQNQEFMKALEGTSFEGMFYMIDHFYVGAGEKLRDSDPQSLSNKVKKAAGLFGADMVGICKLDRRWIYSHTNGGLIYEGRGDDPLVPKISEPQEIPEAFERVIVMIHEMSYDLLSYDETVTSELACDYGYYKMGSTNHLVSSFIRNIGFQAIDCTTNDIGLSIPMAIQAGLGDLGRNGLLITPKYGPRVRINLIITDMPLEPDTPIDFGVTEFCETCKICAKNCPSQSLSHDGRTTEPIDISNNGGVLKWFNNAVTCRQRWALHKPACSVCIATCPFNKPDTSFHRMVRWFVDHLRWGNPFYVWMDKVAGYGKTKPVDNFWEEFIPNRKFKPWE
jgi:reductive dehalogenase